MMVPRSFLNTTAPGRPRRVDQKNGSPPRSRSPAAPLRPKDITSSPRMALRTSSEPATRSTQTVPVRIPQKITFRDAPTPRSSQQASPGRTGIAASTKMPKQQQEKAGGGVNHLLAATAIPRRRKSRQKMSQRLPGGDHVADFSKLILDDVQSPEGGSIAGSLNNPQFDGLFGHLDEQSCDGLEPATGSLMSMRSLSSDSVPSLGNDSTATSEIDVTSPFTGAGQATPERKLRQISSSEDCGEDHPLLHFDSLDPHFSGPPRPDTSDSSSSPKFPTRPNLFQSGASSFRSNLTASLRALKSAAQTVTSIAANPIYPPEDFLTRSAFIFAPELTDDRRPPPSDEQPSPALRRYLNPPLTTSGSPSEFHAWHEVPSSSRLPTPKRKGEKSQDARSSAPPIAIPLQTCIPSAVRSPTASSPPIWLTADGTPSNRKPAESLLLGSSLARQREPRENSDYLRVLVAEMNMKRNGKFRDDAESHAVIFLPARKMSENSTLVGQDRWAVYHAT